SRGPGRIVAGSPKRRAARSAVRATASIAPSNLSPGAADGAGRLASTPDALGRQHWGRLRLHSSPLKNTGPAYLLAALGLVTPVAGIQRFYLGHRWIGLLYLLTWGLFGIGTIVDLVQLTRIVADENRKLLHPGQPIGVRPLGAALPQLALPPADMPRERLTPEQQILRVARDHEGIVTVAIVAVEAGLSLRQTKKELEKLREQEFCTVDVSTDGAKLYVFDGLRSTKPLDLA